MSRPNSIVIHDNLQAALDLAKAGIKVFPVTPDKRPLVKWKAEATTDPAKIRRWWRKWPDAMPAFATGDESGIDVLDLDRKDGKDGFKALAVLGIDPAGLSWVIVETASGGWHLYFARKPGLRCSVGQGDLAGVDVRADRGFVVAPGAVNAKGRYSFLKGGLADLDEEARKITGLASWPAALPMQARVRSGAGDDTANPSGLPLAVLQSALMAIPIAAREEAFGTDLAWFKVARIIHDETGGSEAGNEVWHEWSDGWGGYDPRVSALAREGRIPRRDDGRFDLQAAIRGYVENLRLKTTGSALASNPELNAEKIRLARANAEKVEAANARARGELAALSDVEREWAGILRDVRAALLALPSRAAARLGHLTPHDVATLDREVRAVLNELSE